MTKTKQQLTKVHASWRWKQKAVLTTKTKGRSNEPTQGFDRTSRGQLLDDDRSKDGNKSTNKNDESAMCRRWQCLQTKMSTSVSTRTRFKVFVVALQQELLHGAGTQNSSIVQKPETRNQKPFYRDTPNSSKTTKSTLRVRLTSKMLLKMLLSFCTYESTKPGNQSTFFPGLRSGFCTFESTKLE
jgi:hypothetical protein